MYLLLTLFVLTGINVYILIVIFKRKKINKDVEEQNQSLLKTNSLLMKDKEKIQENISYEKIRLEEMQQLTQNTQKNIYQIFEQYCETLDASYSHKENEYDIALKTLYKIYDDAQDKILNEINKLQQELEKMKRTKAAAIEAQIKEHQVKEDLDKFCLCISNLELNDVRNLEKIKNELNQPRILSMLIWSTYFQKPMTALCNNILGTSTVCGIYKITNQKTGECYIGQAIDVAKRWKDHAKCGLGIDTPINNKLYKAIKEYGIWNFSWELLEKCNKEELNEKEVFYIDLYNSYNYGYNSNRGIKKD